MENLFGRNRLRTWGTVWEDEAGEIRVLSLGQFGGSGLGLAGDLDLGTGDAKSPGPSGVDTSFTPHPYSDSFEFLIIHTARSLKRFCMFPFSHFS